MVIVGCGCLLVGRWSSGSPEWAPRGLPDGMARGEDGEVAPRGACGHHSLAAAAGSSASELGGRCETITDLTHADLRGADLTRADLFGADLTRATLKDADLVGTKLTGGANLTGADMSGANLRLVTGLTSRQLICARFSARTRLPAGVRPPNQPCQ